MNVAVTKDVGFGVVGLMLSSTNAKGSSAGVDPYSWPNGNFQSPLGSTSGYRNVAKDTAVLSFTKSF